MAMIFLRNLRPASTRWCVWWVKVHLWLGLTLGVLGVLIGISGNILVFDHAINARPSRKLSHQSVRAQCDRHAARHQRARRERAIDQFGIRDKTAGVALRATFIVDPDIVIQHVTVNNLNAGRIAAVVNAAALTLAAEDA